MLVKSNELNVVHAGMGSEHCGGWVSGQGLDSQWHGAHHSAPVHPRPRCQTAGSQGEHSCYAAATGIACVLPLSDPLLRYLVVPVPEQNFVFCADTGSGTAEQGCGAVR